MSLSLLKRAGKHIILLLAILSWTIAGCGKDDAVPQHYNPSSPLPLRVDVIATPIPFPTPDDSPDDAFTPSPTVLPEDIDMLATPVPGLTPTQSSQPREVSPIATPTAKPTSTPTPSPKIDEKQAKPSVAPMPMRVVDSPKTKVAVEPDNMPALIEERYAQERASEDESSAVNAEPGQEDITISEEPPEEMSSESEDPPPENDPIVTPYDITIDQLRVCSKLSDRTPSGCTDTFSLASVRKVFTWMKVSDAKPPQMIKHIYYWEKKKVTTVSLKLNYSSMRTWSQKTFKPDQVGTWKVVITTEDGNVMATRTWTVTP